MKSRLSTVIMTAALLVPLCGESAPVPLRNQGPSPVDKVRIDNPAVLSMAGSWKFAITRGQMIDGRFTPPITQCTASSCASGHEPGAAVDDTTASSWRAKDNSMPQWWELDFGRPEEVRGVTWANQWGPKVYYTIRVDAQKGDGQWIQILASTATETKEPKPFGITPGIYRRLRLTFESGDCNGAPRPAAISDLRVTVVRDGKESLWHPAPMPDAESFAQPAFEDSSWAAIPVPANWELHGFSTPTFNQPDDAVGLYRRWVKIPRGFAGKRALWHFDGVWNGAEIFVNGRKVGYHESGWTSFDVDVTEALKPGEKNLFAVRVCKRTSSVDLDTGDYWSLGGIYRDTYLLALPELNVDGITVNTDLDGHYKEATIKAEVDIRGPVGRPFSIKGRIFGMDRKPAPTPVMEGAGVIGADGLARATLQQPVPGPKLWSAEKPNLYYLVVELNADNRTVERVQERFGFRKVEIKNRVFMINGVPVKMTGVCRHDQWFDKGYTLTDACWRRDLELMKDANVNSIRTAHYNHDPRFVELCDEMGFYLLDESPGCWCEPKDPLITEFWMVRMRETWQRDRNRPSVVVWSIGNESEGGIGNMEALKWITRTDPARPAFVSQIVFWQKYGQDIEDYHYPPQSQLIRRRDDPNLKGPIIQTEQPHTWSIDGRTRHDWGLKDLWGLLLKEIWDITWASDLFMGAHIWQWADTQIPDPGFGTIRSEPGMMSALTNEDAEYGMERLFDGKKQVPVYGNTKGIVNANRTLIKPEFWHVKMTYSPVVVGAGTFDAGSRDVAVAITNRYSFTDLSELTCHWQAMAAGKSLAKGTHSVACPPRAATLAHFPITPGMDVLRLEFKNQAGRMVYAARIPRQGYQPAAPSPVRETQGGLTCQDQGGQIVLGLGQSKLVFDKTSGRLLSWSTGTVTVPLDGPRLTLGESVAPRGGYVMSAGDIELRQAKVMVSETNSCPVIRVQGDVYVARGSTPMGVFTYTLTPRKDGDVGLDWNLEWKAVEMKAWEVGVKFKLPGAFNELAWEREGQWSEYPADHVGALEGRVRNGTLSFQSVKRDAYWASLSGSEVYGLALIRADSTLHVRSYFEKGETTFYALSGLGTPPVGDWAKPLWAICDIFLKPDVVRRGSVTLRLVKPMRGE